LDAAVHSALSGLKTLRDKPNAARDDRQKYTAFFGEIAERLYLNSEQARRAISCLGLPAENSDTLIVTLRDGKEAMLQLPSKSATISLRHLAHQLRENVSELVLMLVGLQSYGA
jgi:hypothetical protein